MNTSPQVLTFLPDWPASGPGAGGACAWLALLGLVVAAVVWSVRGLDRWVEREATAPTGDTVGTLREKFAVADGTGWSGWSQCPRCASPLPSRRFVMPAPGGGTEHCDHIWHDDSDQEGEYPS